MNSKTTVIVTAITIPLVLLAILIFTATSSFNSYTQLENKAKAVQVDNQNVLDNTRKMIRETASVSDKEVAALEGIIIGYADKRASGSKATGDVNGINIGMITEAVPSITEIKTLARLQNIIVAGRKDWQNSQTRLLDIKRQGDNLLGMFPSGPILKALGKEEIKVVIVTSKETKANFESGEDNDNWIK